MPRVISFRLVVVITHKHTYSQTLSTHHVVSNSNNSSNDNNDNNDSDGADTVLVAKLLHTFGVREKSSLGEKDKSTKWSMGWAQVGEVGSLFR